MFTTGSFRVNRNVLEIAISATLKSIEINVAHIPDMPIQPFRRTGSFKNMASIICPLPVKTREALNGYQLRKL
jgi:hypothetical protein